MTTRTSPLPTFRRPPEAVRPAPTRRVTRNSVGARRLKRIRRTH